MRKPFHLLMLFGLVLLLLTACVSSSATATETEPAGEQLLPPSQDLNASPPTFPQPTPDEHAEETPEIDPSPTERSPQPAECQDAGPQPGPNEIVITGFVCLRYPIGRTSVDEYEGEGYYGIELDVEEEPDDTFNADGVIIWIPPGTQPGTYAIGTHEYEEGVEKIYALFSYQMNGSKYHFQSLDGSLQLSATGPPYSGAAYTGSFTFTAVVVDFMGNMDMSQMITVTGNFDFKDD